MQISRFGGARSFPYSASPLAIIAAYANYMSRALIPYHSPDCRVDLTGVSIATCLVGHLPLQVTSHSVRPEQRQAYALSYAQHEKPSSLSNWLTPVLGRFLTTAGWPGNATTVALHLPVQIALSWLAPSCSCRPLTDQTKSECSYRTAKLELPFVTDGIRLVLVGRLSVNLQSIRGVCVYGTTVGLIVLPRLNQRLDGTDLSATAHSSRCVLVLLDNSSQFR